MLSYHLYIQHDCIVFYIKKIYIKKLVYVIKDVNAHTILLLAQHDIRYTLNYYYPFKKKNPQIKVHNETRE